ncbi:hypothetical protein NHQ30_010734 [Ciborinia camelliae]|nr:hypothetical protein NHQ30_010734 [Ciborinia camelliae]
MPQRLYSYSAECLLHQISSSPPAIIRHALRFESVSWQTHSPQLLARSRDWKERKSLLNREDVDFRPRGRLMELLIGEQHDFKTREEQKPEPDKKIQEKTREVDGIEDVYHENYTARALDVVDSGAVPCIRGSIDGAQLHWFGNRKPLLLTNFLLLHEERFAKVMRFLMERNPVPGSDEISVMYTVPETKKGGKGKSYDAKYTAPKTERMIGDGSRGAICPS